MNKLIAFLLCGFSVVLVACGEGEATYYLPCRGSLAVAKSS
jgi:hypothetical protein